MPQRMMTLPEKLAGPCLNPIHLLQPWGREGWRGRAVKKKEEQKKKREKEGERGVQKARRKEKPLSFTETKSHQGNFVGYIGQIHSTSPTACFCQLHSVLDSKPAKL